MKMPREPTDPHVIMLAALTRHMARDELAALHRIAQSARRFLEDWDLFCKNHDMEDPDLLVRWLSHEKRHHAETWALDEEIRRMRDNADDYNRCHHAQGEFNRIRLALMDDPDFRGGDGWEKLIERCEDTAKTSSSRRC